MPISNYNRRFYKRYITERREDTRSVMGIVKEEYLRTPLLPRSSLGTELEEVEVTVTRGARDEVIADELEVGVVELEDDVDELEDEDELEDDDDELEDDDEDADVAEPAAMGVSSLAFLNGFFNVPPSAADWKGLHWLTAGGGFGGGAEPPVEVCDSKKVDTTPLFVYTPTIWASSPSHDSNTPSWSGVVGMLKLQPSSS